MSPAQTLLGRLLAAAAEGLEPNARRLWRFLGVPDGAWLELQALGVPGGRGFKLAKVAHVDTLDGAAELLGSAERFGATGVYVIGNRIDPAVATRRPPRAWHVAEKGSASTTDNDIRARAMLAIDCDAYRPSGTSATDEQVAATVEMAGRIRERLASVVGRNAIAVGHTGNGAMVLVALADIPESPELLALVKGILAALDVRYSTHAGRVDVGVHEGKRLTPAWGTTKRKGAPGIADRPHRRTALLCPERVERIDATALEALLAHLLDGLGDDDRARIDKAMGRKPPASSSSSRTATPGDTPFGRANACDVRTVAAHLALLDGEQPRCPGCGSADVGVAFVSNGLKCSHNRCAEKGKPGGFRTPVDLVAEVRGIAPRAAVEVLSGWFGFEGFARRDPEPTNVTEHEAEEAWRHEDDPPPETTPRTAVAAAWGPLDPRYLMTAPPARRWLLRHPTRDGHPCAPCAGDGLLPLGKAGLIVADGGVGKTMSLVALAVAIVAGRRWLGHFEVDHEARRGRVLLALAEEDAEELHRRLYDAAEAYELDAAERARVAAQVVVLPLAGRPVSLVQVGDDRRTMRGSPELAALLELLQRDAGPHGWSLVGLDPFSRWGAEESETDNAIATRTMTAAESLLEVPGRPTVLLAHHASQQGIMTGNVTARGVTGIRNAARWEGVFWAEGGSVWFRQKKSNYSRPMLEEEALRLVRGPGGLLRVPTEAEAAAYQAAAEERQGAKDAANNAAKDARQAARLAELVERVVSVASTEPRSIARLAAAAEMRQEDAQPAVRRAVHIGRLVAGWPERGHERFALPEARQ